MSQINSHAIYSCSYPPDQPLATWVDNQRRTLKNFVINETVQDQPPQTRERIAKLNRLNFVWNALDAAWEENFKRLEKFKADNDHSCVPQW